MHQDSLVLHDVVTRHAPAPLGKFGTVRSCHESLRMRLAARLQVAPFDFLVDDAALSAEEIAQERREASMWLGDGVYALLPHACLILESVPHQGSCWDGTPLKPTAAAAPATTAAARSGSQHHCLLSS